MAKTAILQLLFLACFIEVCLAVRTWNDLRVRFSHFKSKGYHKVPLNSRSDDFGDYIKVKNEPDFHVPVDIYCIPEDPRGCVIFDKKGNAAGFQISFLKEDLTSVNTEEYDISKVRDFKETKFFNMPAYSYRVYFTNPEKLTDEGRQNLTETAEGIWVYLDGKLLELPRYQPSTPEYEGFYQQGCLSKMGVHYFHDINKNVTDCTKIFPLFMLYEDNNLVGIGLATAGKGTSGTKRNWYEKPPLFAISKMVPNAPPCLTELAANNGVTSMHVYLVDKPWMISCGFFDTLINKAADWLPF